MCISSASCVNYSLGCALAAPNGTGDLEENTQPRHAASHAGEPYYSGSIQEAIGACRSNKAFLIVFLEGTVITLVRQSMSRHCVRPLACLLHVFLLDRRLSILSGLWQIEILWLVADRYTRLVNFECTAKWSPLSIGKLARRATILSDLR